MTVPDGPFAVRNAKKPEYETLAAFGTMTLNDVVESIITCNDLCDRYGMDTISVGTAIAFAMECFEAGLIGRDDTGGLDLRWGDPGSIVALTGKARSASPCTSRGRSPGCTTRSSGRAGRRRT